MVAAAKTDQRRFCGGPRIRGKGSALIGATVRAPSPGDSYLTSGTEVRAPTPAQTPAARVRGKPERAGKVKDRNVCVCVSLRPPNSNSADLWEWTGATKVGGPSPRLSLKVGRWTASSLALRGPGFRLPPSLQTPRPRSRCQRGGGGLSPPPPPPIPAHPPPAGKSEAVVGFAPAQPPRWVRPEALLPTFESRTGLGASRERSPGGQGSGSFTFLFLRDQLRVGRTLTNSNSPFPTPAQSVLCQPKS